MKSVFLLLFLTSTAAAADMHENHEWLQNKYNAHGQSCCSGGQSGDCQPVPFDSYTEDSSGGVRYGKFYFLPENVYSTEDRKGRPVLCIFNNQPRCAFVPRGV